MESDLRRYHNLFAGGFTRQALEGPLPSPHHTAIAQTFGCADGILGLTRHDVRPPHLPRACQTTATEPSLPALVILAYTAGVSAGLVDRRVYLPSAWFTDETSACRRSWALPATATYRSASVLGEEMLRQVIGADQLPYRWVAVPEACGVSLALLDELHNHDKYFLVEIARQTPARRYPSKAVSEHTRPLAAPAPQRVDALALRLPANLWRSYTFPEVAPEAGHFEMAAQRVFLPAAFGPLREEWLITCRAPGTFQPSQWGYYRSNAPAKTPLSLLARLTVWHAPVAAALAECHSTLPGAKAAGQTWSNWHQQTALAFVAHGCLSHLRRQYGAAAPTLTLAQMQRVLELILPQADFDAGVLAAEIRRIQRQNLSGYLAQRG